MSDARDLLESFLNCDPERLTVHRDTEPWLISGAFSMPSQIDVGIAVLLLEISDRLDALDARLDGAK